MSSSLLSVSIDAEVTLILGILRSSPPEVSKPFSEFHFHPLLSTDSARARAGDVLDHHVLRGVRAVDVRVERTSGGTQSSRWRRPAGAKAAGSKPAQSVSLLLSSFIHSLVRKHELWLLKV